ncbi:unnamed protein product [Zymoseptoria tritici ST99CH_1A5]|uniref:Ecp2 effector protein domain-containing protein n=2 Tax=Zymoseptoria tritici TaxID=1047171 RepID=A0A2H1H4E7_ZYMTR|nr:unnamed protein product [Zymoseptoria tritici ST99CH_1E4]SMY29202.1 unnamed protein product [Zymoseptoria tritici ST99CH_1A5]
MQIPIVGVILSSLGMVHAFTTYEIVFWSGTHCQGAESHRMTGNEATSCGKPAGVPNSFDAQSATVRLLKDCTVVFYTDNNQQCNFVGPGFQGTSLGPFQGPDGVAAHNGHSPWKGPTYGCAELDPRKRGKWKLAQVNCG